MQAEAAIEEAREVARTAKREKATAQDFDEVIKAVCPQCGAPVSGGKFCPKCGAALAAFKFCSECGKKIPASARFCPECGKPLQQA